jgi:signal peptidase I
MKKKDEQRKTFAAPKEKKDKFREYFEAILVAVIFASFVKIFIFQTYKIPTESMVKTLLVGDHLIVDKFGFRDPGSGLLKKLLPFKDIQRGDVVVFKFPKEPRFFFVKRVIGLPGDVVQIISKKIYVNGQPQEEPYAVFADENVFPPDAGLPDILRYRDNTAEIPVPPGQYFCMGDNRDRSNDSRFWGFVPRDAIAGRAWIIYWSYEAPRYDPNRSLAGKTWDFVKVFPTFFHKTRWERSFTWVR